eukprot:6139838-Prymnesium_polylepis.3
MEVSKWRSQENTGSRLAHRSKAPNRGERSRQSSARLRVSTVSDSTDSTEQRAGQRAPALKTRPGAATAASLHKTARYERRFCETATIVSEETALS